MINDFLYRVGDALSRSRSTVIKWLLVAAAIVIVIALALYGVERLQEWSYEKGVAAGEALYQKQKAEAQAAQARADDLKLQIAVLDAEVSALRKRSAAASTAYHNAKTKTASLKEEYEETRNNPVPAVDVSVADACASLAAVGYPCQ